MFGVLTVFRLRLPFFRRLWLRLFPARGLSLSLSSYRMASWRTARLELPEGLRPAVEAARVRRALLELRAAGVRRLVAPAEYHALAQALGLAPVQAGPALRSCAARAMTECCRAAGLDPENVCVLVCADVIDRPCSDQLLTLARSVRTLRLLCPDPMPILRGRLLAARGIAAEGPPPEDAVPAALVLSGAPPRSAAIAVDLSGGQADWPMPVYRPRALLPAEVRIHMPEGAEEGAFLAALCLCGGLTAREIGLDIPEPTPYNKESLIEHAPAENQAIRVETRNDAGHVVLSPREIT